MNAIVRYTQDFISLFFPRLCAACATSLVNNEGVVCTHCLYQFPYTNFHLQDDNPVARQFWGRLNFGWAGAFVYFNQKSAVQRAIHQLKYNNKREVGTFLGSLYAEQLTELLREHPADVIVPVPLAVSRQRKRGYNQSECIARGMATVLHLPVDTLSLKRMKLTDTQTRKGRFSRLANMNEAFVATAGPSLEGKSILIVDDVITTGATIESCALALQEIPGVKISIAALAYVR